VASKKTPKAAATKRKIFNAAIELIKAKGFLNVTIDEIAAHCGLTKGAFYYYFESKDSLIASAYTEVDAAVMQKMPQIIKANHSLELFLEINMIYAEHAEHKGVEVMKQIFRHNLEPLGCYERANEFYNSEKRIILQLYASLFKSLQENGQARQDVTFEHFFHSLSVTFDGVVLDWCYFNGSYSLKEAAREAILRLLEHYKAPERD
jgi:TetR/AcrR family fatty acid metabolism transcriptional regulator